MCEKVENILIILYVQIRELDESTTIVVAQTNHDDPASRETIITAIREDVDSAGEKVDIFTKIIPGKSWDECTDEQLEQIADSEFTAEEIIKASNLECVRAVSSIFQLEYPNIRDRSGAPLRTIGIITPSGQLKIRKIRKKGFGAGQYPVNFMGTAATAIKVGASANQTNQIKAGVTTDLHQDLLEFDAIAGALVDINRLPGSYKFMQNLMDKVLKATDDKVVEDIEKISKSTLCFDTKWLKFSSSSQKDKSKLGKEVLTLIAAGFQDAEDIPIAASVTETDNTGSEKSALSCATTVQLIFEKLVPDEDKRQEIYDKIIAFCFDTTGLLITIIILNFDDIKGVFYNYFCILPSSFLS